MSRTTAEAVLLLRRRLTLAASASVAVVLLVTAVVLVAWQRHELMSSLDLTLRRDADAVEADLRDDGVVHLGVTSEDRGAQVIDAAGHVVAASHNLAGARPLGTAPIGGDRLRTITGVPIEDDPYRLLSRRVDVDSVTYAVNVVANSGDVDDSVDTLTDSLLIAFPIVLALLGLLTWWLVGRTLQPVAIATERQDRFVGDASHELRTPLARARTRLEVDAAHPGGADHGESASIVLDELIGMERLIDDLLFLARPDAAGRPAGNEIVDLDDLVLAEAAALRAESPGVVVDTSAANAARVRGNPDELVRVVRNILDNARRHATSQVFVSLVEAGQQAVLTVDDDGAGIPPERREEVFGRFVRLEDARTPGAGRRGLGLAIARDIVERHRGTITAGESPAGGLRVTVTLPRAD